MNAIPLRLKTKDGRHVTTYGILDACSSRHFMSEELGAALNIKGTPRNLTIGTVTANNKEVLSTSVIASVEDLERTNSYDLEFDILNLEHLKDAATPVQADIKQFPQLQHLQHFEAQIPFIMLIIGIRDHELHIPSEVIHADSGLTRVRRERHVQRRHRAKGVAEL